MLTFETTVEPLSPILQAAALNSAANGVVITDRDGRIVWVNPAFTSLTGYTAEEVLGQTPRVLRSAKHDQSFYENLWSTIIAGRVWHGEITNHRKDGSEYTEEMTITPVRTNGDQIIHFIAIKQDISQRKRLEEQLYRTQKLEAVGRLAGGMAHDFNNALTVIIGLSELVQESLDADDPMCGRMVAIRQAADHAAELTRRLLAFSRRQILQPRVLSLNTLVAGMQEMLQRLIGEHIELTSAFRASRPIIKADPGQLEQVLMNLTVNARDAMAKGGRLTIETANVELDETYCVEHRPVRPGHYVMLTVSDTGCGMDSETLSRVYEPFFTTKKQGEGTGLGLSMVYGIVKQSEGYIWAYSEPKRGSTFKLYFPEVGNAVSQVATPAAQPSARGGAETILLVEDDQAARELICESLTRKGYHVLSAPDGASAKEFVRQQNQRVDLVLTDWLMPGMNGGELIVELKSLNPKIKSVCMSGFVPGDIGQPLSLGPEASFLQKPFTQAALLTRVRAVLDD